MRKQVSSAILCMMLSLSMVLPTFAVEGEWVGLDDVEVEENLIENVVVEDVIVEDAIDDVLIEDELVYEDYLAPIENNEDTHIDDNDFLCGEDIDFITDVDFDSEDIEIDIEAEISEDEGSVGNDSDYFRWNGKSFYLPSATKTQNAGLTEYYFRDIDTAIIRGQYTGDTSAWKGWWATGAKYIYCDFSIGNLTSLEHMFYNNTSSSGAVEIYFTDNFDTSQVTNMNGMFEGLGKLKRIYFTEKFDTSNVTNMGSMFSGCSSLNELDLSNFNTSHVTNMSCFLSNANTLRRIQFSDLFDTSQVTNMRSMFYCCRNLESLDLSSFDFSNVQESLFWISNLGHNVGGTILDMSGVDLKNLKKISLNCSLCDIKIMYIPCNAPKELKLPTFNNTDVWYDINGNEITYCPIVSKSTVIKKNSIPTIDDMKAEQYNISFDALGEGLICYKTKIPTQKNITIRTKESGTLEELPIVKSSNGKMFLGWKTSSGEYVDETTVFEEDTIVYAVYSTKVLSQSEQRIMPKAVYYNYKNIKKDITTRTQTIDNAHEGFSINIESESPEYVKQYRLRCGAKIIAESIYPAIRIDNTAELPLGSGYYIDLIGKDGSTCSVNILLRVKQANLGLPQKVSLGKGISFILPEDVPLIGGEETTLSLPELPVSVVCEDNKIKVGINVIESALYSNKGDGGELFPKSNKKSFGEKWKEFGKDSKKSINILKDMKGYMQDTETLKADIPGMSSKVNFNVMGYFEGEYDGSNISDMTKLTGQLVISIDYSQTKQSVHMTPVPFTSFVVPTTVMITGKIGCKATIGLDYDLENAKLFTLDGISSRNPNLKLIGSLELYGGVGVGKALSGGAYGKAEVGTSLEWKSKKTGNDNDNNSLTLEEIYLYGEAGVKAYFAGESITQPLISSKILHDEWPEYIDKSGHLLLYSKDENSIYNLCVNGKNTYSYNEDGCMEDSAIINQTIDLGEMMDFSVAEPEDSVFLTEDINGCYVENAYLGAAPQIAKLADKTIVIYVDYDKERSGIDATELKYFIINEDGSASEPMAALDDNTADTNPVLYTYNGDIFCAYLNSNKVFGDVSALDIDDYVRCFGVSVCRFDAENNVFVDLGYVSAEYTYSYLPHLIYTDEGLMAVWVENEDNNIYGLTSKNRILASIYDNNQWSSPRVVNEDRNSVSSLAVCRTGDISWIESKDNALDGGEQILYINGNKIYEGNISNLIYTNLPGINGEVLAFENNGGVFYCAGSEVKEYLPEGIMDINSKFEVYKNGIYYYKTEDEIRNIYASYKRSGEVTTAKLTSRGEYVDYYSFSNGRMAILTTNVSFLDNDIDTDSAIYILDDSRYDLSLDYIDYYLTDVVPGKELPISLEVTNNGTKMISGLKLFVNDEYKADINCVLRAGESKTIDSAIVLPEIIDEDITIKLEGIDEADSDNTDNSEILEISRTDLSVKVSYMVKKDGYFMEAIIANESNIESEAVFTAYDRDENEIYSSELNLPAKSSKIELIKIDSLIPTGYEESVVAGVVRSIQEDYDDLNNRDTCVIWNVEPEDVAFKESEFERVVTEQGIYSDNTLCMFTSDGSAVIGIPIDEYDVDTLSSKIWNDTRALKIKSVTVNEKIVKLSAETISNCTNLGVLIVLNPMCVIEDGAITSGVRIRGYYASKAYDYAIENGYTFEAIDEFTHNHFWDDGVVITPPTNTKEGKKQFTCIYCKEIYEDTLSRLTEEINEKNTITFNPCNGIESSYSVEVENGSLCDNVPTVSKEHYTFEGWFTSENGGGTRFDPSDLIYEDMVFYAYWILEEYDVILVNEFDTEERSVIKVKYNQQIGKLPNCSQNGYIFKGWYTEKNGNGKQVTSQMVVTEPMSVYAYWTMPTITFDADGGNADVLIKQVLKNEAIGEIPNAVRKGYDFLGWYTEKNGNGIKVDEDYIVMDDMTIYAHWTLAEYNVILVNEFDTEEHSVIKVKYNQPIGELPNYSRNGYMFFKGWYTEKNGNGIKVDEDYIVMDDMTIYAYWIELDETTFNCLNGNHKNAQIVFDTIQNDNYYFEENDNGEWKSNNVGINSTDAYTKWIVNIEQDDFEFVIRYGVSSEKNYDTYTLIIDDEIIADEISGDIRDKEYTAILSKGLHSIEAIYAKDFSNHCDDDCAYVIFDIFDSHICEYCGNIQQHNFTELVEIQPTCIDDGRKDIICECGYRKDFIIDKLGHNVKKYILGESDICDRCNTVFAGAAYDENYNLIKKLTKNDIENCNYSINAAIVYIPKGTKKINCSFGEGLSNVVIPSSVTSIGFGAFYYSGIDKVVIPYSVKEIDDYYNFPWETIIECFPNSEAQAYAVENGYTYEILDCEQCPHIDKTISKKKNATCTVNGYTGDEICSYCGKCMVKGSVIKAKGHSWDKGNLTVKPTLTTEGKKVYVCTVCKNKKTEVVPKLSGFKSAKIILNKGDKAKKSNFINNTGKKVTYKSSNTAVVKVDSKGLLTAKGIGTAKITATVDKKTYTCTITVYNPTISGSSSVKTGKSITLKIKDGNGKTTWTSSNKKIATVSSKGVVKGIKKGKVTITAKNNGKTIKKTITVK